MTTFRSADVRLSPADGIALSAASYDLRGRDGKLVCTVSRGRAESGLRSGALELWRGQSGIYLRAAGLSYPSSDRATSRPANLATIPRGAVRPVVHTSRNAATGQVGSVRTRRVGPVIRRAH